MNTHAASSTFRAALTRGWTPFSTGMAIILCAIYLALFGFRALVQFDVTVESGYSSFFKIYWASGDDGFTASKMREVYIKPDGRIASRRGTPIYAAHGNARSLYKLELSHAVSG